MILVDTGPIVALLNDRDDQHARCRDFLAHHPGPLLVPTTVFTEVCILVERRRGTRAELAFLAVVRAGLFTLLETTSADLGRIADLVTTWTTATSASSGPDTFRRSNWCRSRVARRRPDAEAFQQAGPR